MKTIRKISARLALVNIGAQLFGAFVLVLSLGVALGVFSIANLGRVNDMSHELAQKWMFGIGHTTTIRAAVLEARELEVKHSRAADVGYMDEYEEKMKLAFAVISDNANKYQALVKISGDEKLLYDAFSKAWADYLTINAKVVSLGRSNKQDDAKDIGEGAAKSAVDDAILALDKLTTYNFDGAKATAQQADALYAKTSIWTWGLLVGEVVIGLVLARIITRGLLAQLGAEPRYVTGLTQRIAQGDLSVEIDIKRGDVSSLLDAIVTMRDNLSGIVKDVRRGSEGVVTASAEIAQGNDDLSERTDRQARALARASSAMEQLGATVKQNAESAKQANQLAVNASQIAGKGGSVVANVVETMKGIDEASRKISAIIGVIDGIAFQTNILALNAAVEAARAGEQGRGFAVVANEVRSLAARSAEAAKEIKVLINTNVARVESGRVLVNQAGTTMDEVVNSIKHVTDIVGEISTASHEQAIGVAQVGASVGQMDQATQQNAALVQQMAAAANGLKTQASDLMGSVTVFKLAQLAERVYRPLKLRAVNDAALLRMSAS